MCIERKKPLDATNIKKNSPGTCYELILFWLLLDTPSSKDEHEALGAAGPIPPTPNDQQTTMSQQKIFVNVHQIFKTSAERSQSCREDRPKIKSFSFVHRPNEFLNIQEEEESRRRKKDREQKHGNTDGQMEHREGVEKEKRKSKKKDKEVERTESLRSQPDQADEQGRMYNIILKGRIWVVVVLNEFYFKIS